MEGDAQHDGLRRGASGAAAAAGASLLDPGRNCYRAVRAPRVALLVDADEYFKAFMLAAQRATRSILILGWDFDTRTRLQCEPGGPPSVLGEFLNFLVRRRRALHIHILNWDYPMVFGTDRELPPRFGFSWRPRRRVHL